MRKFTKGLLLTFIASAMSLGAYAQDGGGIKGYYRIINAGYQGQKWNKGVMYISQKTTAKPELSSDDAITEPGTVMFLNAIPMEEAPETTGKYEDVYPEKDLEVLNLRSQGVDASAAVYSPLVDLLKGGFTDGLKYANTKDNWKFKEAELNEKQMKPAIPIFNYIACVTKPHEKIHYESAVRTLAYWSNNEYIFSECLDNFEMLALKYTKLFPERCEAYYILSKVYRYQGLLEEAEQMKRIGIGNDNDLMPIFTNYLIPYYL